MGLGAGQQTRICIMETRGYMRKFLSVVRWLVLLGLCTAMSPRLLAQQSAPLSWQTGLSMYMPKNCNLGQGWVTTDTGNLYNCIGGSWVTSNVPPGIVVSSLPYNVKGDAQIAANATPLAPGTNPCPGTASFGCVETAANAFVPSDTGKLIWSMETSDGEVAQPSSTILKVDSPTLVEVSADYTRDGIGNVVWGTNYTTQIQAAATAINASGGTLFWPCGNYILTEALEITASMQGASETCTVFYPVGNWPGGGILAFVGAGNNSAGQHYSDFSLNGAGGIIRNVSPGFGILFYNQYKTTAENISAQNISSDNTIFAIEDVHQSTFVNSPYVNNPAPQSSNQCYLNGDSNITLITPLCSNGGQANMLINGSVVTMVGGVNDECGLSSGACLQLTGSNLSVMGTSFYGGNAAGVASISVDGTSTANISNAFIVPYSHGGGIQVASGGVVTLTGTTVSSTSTGATTITNSGTIYDDGGNTFTATSSATLLSGNAPVSQFSYTGTFSGGLNTHVYTVSALPAASSVAAGLQFIVSDATSFTPGTCTGGGSDYMIAVSNGTTWSCH